MSQGEGLFIDLVPAAPTWLSAPAFYPHGFATLDKTLCVREKTKISERQLGRKIGKHAADFGLDPANPAHRAQLRRLITEIITAPERVVAGTFRGQGAVKFFIKGEDVVVTTPIEDFVTILKGGVHNPAVQRALQL